MRFSVTISCYGPVKPDALHLNYVILNLKHEGVDFFSDLFIRDVNAILLSLYQQIQKCEASLYTCKTPVTKRSVQREFENAGFLFGFMLSNCSYKSFTAKKSPMDAIESRCLQTSLKNHLKTNYYRVRTYIIWSFAYRWMHHNIYKNYFQLKYISYYNLKIGLSGYAADFYMDLIRGMDHANDFFLVFPDSLRQMLE
jgi:hypothetical protein